jgi:ABC-2 type transport system permease protein
LVLLLVLGLGAVMLASVGFGIGFIYLLRLMTYRLDFFFYNSCVLLLSSIFLYILHLVVGLRFGKGASIGLGIVESLLSALFLTGLGEGRWQILPCAWGARFVSGFVQYTSGMNVSSYVIPELHTGIVLCVVETIAVLLFACVWFYRWEGRKSEE